MIRIACLLTLLCGSGLQAQPLTFEEAAGLAARRLAAASGTPRVPQLSALRGPRLPNVRAEVNANTSRTLDLFAEGPYESRYATSVLAFDYPLWDNGARAARIDALEARLRRTGGRGGLGEGHFHQLVEAFGHLYLAQQEVAVISPILDELARDEGRSEALLSAGEITNLTAVDRRDAILAMQSQLLEAEARRIDAAMRLQLLTGLEDEPDVTLDSSAAAKTVSVTDERVRAISVALEESRARLRQVAAGRGFQAMLSGYAGVGAARSSFGSLASEGSFGVYGLRIHLSYPLFRDADGLSLAEARADLEHNLSLEAEAVDAARLEAAEYRLRLGSADRRIDLLRRSLEAAVEREAALVRLVEGGIRLPSDLAHARADRARRQVALLGAEVERWKAGRLLAGTAAGPGNE